MAPSVASAWGAARTADRRPPLTWTRELHVGSAGRDSVRAPRTVSAEPREPGGKCTSPSTIAATAVVSPRKGATTRGWKLRLRGGPSSPIFGSHPFDRTHRTVNRVKTQCGSERLAEWGMSRGKAGEKRDSKQRTSRWKTRRRGWERRLRPAERRGRRDEGSIDDIYTSTNRTRRRRRLRCPRIVGCTMYHAFRDGDAPTKHSSGNPPTKGVLEAPQRGHKCL